MTTSRDLSSARYAPPRHAAPIDLPLAGNEGPAAAAPLLQTLLDALGAAGADVLRRYPSQAALEAELAARLDVAADRVLVTAGADEAIDRLFRAVLDTDRTLLLPEPTFEMMPRYARLCGARIVSIPWPTGPYPTDAVCAAIDERTAVVTMVSPNNPTGAVATAADLERVAAAAPHAVVLLDAAYAEFADEDLTANALALPNTLVLRTLSKAWGLAGLRIGYAVGRPDLIALLRASGSPYSVAAPSIAIARAALTADDATRSAYVERVRHERRQLHDDAVALDLGAQPSQGNFVLLRTARPQWIRDGLAGLGIGVRIFEHDALRDAVRVTCPGEAADFERLRRALASVAAPQAILFDLDGVLADVSGSYRAAIEATARAFGVEVTAEDVRRAKAAGDANDDWQLTWSLIRAGGGEASLAAVTETFEDLYQGSADRPGLRRHERPLIDRAWLERLRTAVPLGVVTGRPRSDAAQFLTEHRLDDLFATIVCREDGPLKPDPEPVRIALRTLGVERAWMIGDTPDDVRAARAAGVVPLGYRAPGDDADNDAVLTAVGAARVLTDLRELEELLP